MVELLLMCNFGSRYCQAALQWIRSDSPPVSIRGLDLTPCPTAPLFKWNIIKLKAFREQQTEW